MAALYVPTPNISPETRNAKPQLLNSDAPEQVSEGEEDEKLELYKTVKAVYKTVNICIHDSQGQSWSRRRS